MWKRSPQAHGQSPIGQDSRQSAGSNSFPVKRICERDAKELAEGARRNDARAAVVVDSFPEKPTVKQRQKRGCKSETKNRKHPETKPGCLFSVCKRKCDDERIKTKLNIFLTERGSHLWSIVASVTKVVPSLDSKS